MRFLCSWGQLLYFSIFHSTKYPLPLDGQRQHGMRSLPDVFTHDHQLELNPRHFDLESSALSTLPHVLWFTSPQNFFKNHFSLEYFLPSCLLPLLSSILSCPEHHKYGTLDIVLISIMKEESRCLCLLEGMEQVIQIYLGESKIVIYE